MLELTELGPFLPRVDGLEDLGSMVACGKGCSTFAVGCFGFSSPDFNVSSSLGPDFGGVGPAPTSFPLLRVIALALSKPPFGFGMVELGSCPGSRNLPTNSAICPICFSS
ncbi:hypothetical protein EV2_003322 [Malus domestica]